tara:strand:+ start:1617 stop:1919 length:303 start_codon:yes stop_codon:yes gene_type:complete
MLFKEKQLRNKMKTVTTMRNLYEAVEWIGDEINIEDAQDAIQRTIWSIEDEIGFYAHFESLEEAEKEKEKRIKWAKDNNYEICDFFFSPKHKKKKTNKGA